MPGKWWPIAPNAPTKRKMSWALHRAWAAVKSGISRTGVPTKSRRSRHRSKIQGEALLGADEDTGVCGRRFAGNFANGIAWVAIAVWIIQIPCKGKLRRRCADSLGGSHYGGKQKAGGISATRLCNV